MPPRWVESITRSTASKLACGKAAASRRTPKQRNVATVKNLWSPSPEPVTGLRSFPGCASTAPEAFLPLINHSYCLPCATRWRAQVFPATFYPYRRSLYFAFTHAGASSPQDATSAPTFACLSIALVGPNGVRPSGVRGAPSPHICLLPTAYCDLRSRCRAADMGDQTPCRLTNGTR